MNYFAIGLPGEKPRMFISGSPDMAALQLQDGETYVEVEELANGIISLDGDAYETLGADMEQEGIKIRSYRAVLLSSCDWTMTVDAPLTEEEKAAWMTYRQALRDLPADQPNTLFEDVVWPEQP